MDAQKAHDCVQHEQHALLWEQLASVDNVGVQDRMLAAINPLYTSGTLYMKVGGTAECSWAAAYGCQAGLSAQSHAF